MPSQRNDTHYDMNHEKRGIALIFNHFRFKLDLEDRNGTEKDAKSMKDMLEELHFDVRMHDDNDLNLLKQNVEEVANLNHQDYDCFVMVVLTHGDDKDILYASDNIYLSDILWSPFLADACPSLAGKPKLFFIQACRGSKYMSSATAGKNRMDSPSNNNSYKIPSQADFLFAFASVPGYVALRNTNTGSWFIEALCKEFRNNAKNYDILTLLTFVIQNVAVNYEHKYQTKESTNATLKQIPCVTTSLTRLLKFNKKGIYSSTNLGYADEYHIIDQMFERFFRFIIGLVASLFFGLINILCSIPIILTTLCTLPYFIIDFFKHYKYHLFWLLYLFLFLFVVFNGKKNRLYWES